MVSEKGEKTFGHKTEDKDFFSLGAKKEGLLRLE
jgi:hypothetical protein